MGRAGRQQICSGLRCQPTLLVAGDISAGGEGEATRIRVRVGTMEEGEQWEQPGGTAKPTCSESRTLLALMLLMAGKATEPMLPTPMAAKAHALLGASARATSLVKEAHRPAKPTSPVCTGDIIIGHVDHSIAEPAALLTASRAAMLPEARNLTDQEADKPVVVVCMCSGGQREGRGGGGRRSGQTKRVSHAQPQVMLSSSAQIDINTNSR